VMIVSTDAILRDLLGIILRRQGVWASMAASLPEARYAIQAHPVDLVFLDARPLTEDAAAIPEKLWPSNRRGVLVLLLGPNDTELAAHPDAAGAEAALVHPFPEKEIMQVVSNLVGFGGSSDAGSPEDSQE